MLFRFRKVFQYTCIVSPVQPCGSVRQTSAPSEAVQTLQYLSDGMFVYWVYALRTQESAPHPITGDRVKQHLVYLQRLEMQVRQTDRH